MDKNNYYNATPLDKQSNLELHWISNKYSSQETKFRDFDYYPLFYKSIKQFGINPIGLYDLHLVMFGLTFTNNYYNKLNSYLASDTREIKEVSVEDMKKYLNIIKENIEKAIEFVQFSHSKSFIDAFSNNNHEIGRNLAISTHYFDKLICDIASKSSLQIPSEEKEYPLPPYPPVDEDREEITSADIKEPISDKNPNYKKETEDLPESTVLPDDLEETERNEYIDENGEEVIPQSEIDRLLHAISSGEEEETGTKSTYNPEIVQENDNKHTDGTGVLTQEEIATLLGPLESGKDKENVIDISAEEVADTTDKPKIEKAFGSFLEDFKDKINKAVNDLESKINENNNSEGTDIIFNDNFIEATEKNIYDMMINSGINGGTKRFELYMDLTKTPDNKPLIVSDINSKSSHREAAIQNITTIIYGIKNLFDINKDNFNSKIIYAIFNSVKLLIANIGMYDFGNKPESNKVISDIFNSKCF